MQDRLAHHARQFLEDIFPSALGGVNHRRQGGIGTGPPFRAEAPHHLAMNDRWAQRSLAGVIIRRDIRAVQEHEQMLAVGAIAVQQIPSQSSGHWPFQQPVEPLLQASDLAVKAPGGQVVTLVPQMNGGPEQGLHFPGPPQAWPLVNQALQVANLMGQTQLMHLGRSVQLGPPTITLPHLRAALAHEGSNHVVPPTRTDQVILPRLTGEPPLPPVTSLDPGARFVTADDLALPHLLANRLAAGCATVPARSRTATAPPSLSPMPNTSC